MRNICDIISLINIQNFKKLYYIYKAHGFKYVLHKSRAFYIKNKGYQRWYLQIHLPKPDELAHQRGVVFDYMPLISIVVPTYNTPKQYLIEMLDSVINQTYSNWELCIADGASTNNDTLRILEEYASRHKNIKIIYLQENYHISGNTNMALTLATGDYVAFFDHDDLLAPNCLFEYVKAINESINNKPSLLYCNEDTISHDGKVYYGAFLKGEFSIYSLRSNNYITHFLMIRADILKQAGEFDSKCDGAQDYDMTLRVIDIDDNVCYVNKVLYHWRVHENSSAFGSVAKPYTHAAGKYALTKHLQRNNILANVEDGLSDNTYKIKYTLLNNPLISIIIPNKDAQSDLKKCIESIYQKSTYSNFEVLIVENNSTTQEIFDYYHELETKYPNLRILKYPDSGFNYSKINNYAVPHANGEHILLLNNDTEVITPNWLEELLMYSQFSDVGCVGALLYYPDDTIQHAGIIFGGAQVPQNHGCRQSRYSGLYNKVKQFHVVTGACLMIKKSAYFKVGGLTEGLAVAFNDVDFCLKIEQAGYANIFNPFCELYHYESKTRGYEDIPEKQIRFKKEVDLFCSIWGSYRSDKYYPSIR